MPKRGKISCQIKIQQTKLWTEMARETERGGEGKMLKKRLSEAVRGRVKLHKAFQNFIKLCKILI